MRMIHKIVKKVLSFTLLPFLRIYLNSPRTYQYQGINLRIIPGVFHPGFFFSTQFLLKYIKHLPLNGRSFLELGAGSGLISFYANLKGAKVTASDISTNVIQNIAFNQLKNGVNFEVIHSDLFTEFGDRKFEMILINPPYFKRNPKSEADYAWYCGENSEYFIRLFSELNNFICNESLVFMILSEECAIVEIKQIAKQNNFVLKVVKRKRIWLEENFIFEVKAIISQ